MLCSFNLQSTFMEYPFYHPSVTPVIIGAILAIVTGYCLLGGGKRIVSVTSTLVPVMGVSYVIICLIVILFNIQNVPDMFLLIFRDAFDFQSILGGVAGSCMVYGIKRGLYSNEAGVGSAPIQLLQMYPTLQSRDWLRHCLYILTPFFFVQPLH